MPYLYTRDEKDTFIDRAREAGLSARQIERLNRMMSDHEEFDSVSTALRQMAATDEARARMNAPPNPNAPASQYEDRIVRAMHAMNLSPQQINHVKGVIDRGSSLRDALSTARIFAATIPGHSAEAINHIEANIYQPQRPELEERKHRGERQEIAQGAGEAERIRQRRERERQAEREAQRARVREGHESAQAQVHARNVQEHLAREQQQAAMQQHGQGRLQALRMHEQQQSLPHYFQADEPSAAHAQAVSEAMARAQAAANVPIPPQAAPAIDPSLQSSRRDIDPARARAAAEIMERAKQLSLQPPYPMGNPRDRFAFPTPQENHPLEMARNYGVQNPYYYRAQDQAELANQPLHQGIHRYMNPYQQHVVDRIAEEGNRNLFENILPNLEARYMKLGQHGGRRHHDLQTRALRDVQKEISSAQSQALAGGYENAAQNFNADMARQLEASRMQAVLGQQSQASRLADMAALREAEQESRGFRQNVKDYEQHELNRIQQHPQEMLNMYSQMLQGQPYATSTQSYVPSSPQSLHRRDYQRAIIPFLTQMGSQFLG